MRHTDLRAWLVTGALLGAACSSSSDVGLGVAGAGSGSGGGGSVVAGSSNSAGGGTGPRPSGSAGAAGLGVGGLNTTGGSASSVTGGSAASATGGVATGGTRTGSNGGSAGTGVSGGAPNTAAGSSAGGASGGGSSMPASTELVGFATLNGGTTGGRGGQTVTVKTYADLKTYAESTAPYIIMVQGTISNGPNGGQIRVKSNKSIIGVGGDAFLNGVGIDIGSTSNIIIQNLRISMTGVTTRTETAGVYTASDDAGLAAILVNGGDAISINGTSKNIWVDHCELFSEDPSVQTNKDLYDGLLDIKGQSGFITVSWTYFHDHHKCGLVGSSDTDLYDDRKVTFHHNYYKNVKLRMPMYRGSVGHFFNNYLVGAEDATEIRADTCVRVEKNYYESLHYSIYTPADSPGKTERIDNVEVSRTSRAYPANCTADIPYNYAMALTSTTNDVKTIVPQRAGVGKL